METTQLAQVCRIALHVALAHACSDSGHHHQQRLYSGARYARSCIGVCCQLSLRSEAVSAQSNAAVYKNIHQRADFAVQADLHSPGARKILAKPRAMIRHRAQSRS